MPKICLKVKLLLSLKVTGLKTAVADDLELKADFHWDVE
jgi:hypothetical protein